jgi:hypothetical protein
LELELSNEKDQVFFMVQEMEAWMLSQPNKIEFFCLDTGLIRKREDERITDNQLLKGKCLEEIEKPSGKLNTIFIQLLCH